MDTGRLPFSAFYIRNFRLFWIAQLISLSGTWMHMVGQGWLVYQLTHSPLYLGFAGAALSLPILIFTLFGGILADRHSKRTILIITQFLNIFPPLLLGILTFTGKITVWHVIAIAFVIGTINAFDLPVRQSFLIEMVGKGRLMNAIALNSASFHGARILGPLIAGLVISRLGLSACFFINAVSFIPVVIALRGMTIEEKTKKGVKKDILYELREGFHFILGKKDIMTMISIIIVFSLFGLPYNHFLPVFAEDVLKIGASGLGYMMSAAGLGAFSAAMIIAFRGDIRNKQGTIAIASIIFPVALIVFTFSTQFWLSMALLLTFGLTLVSFFATANSFIQMGVPDELRGRVMSVYSLVFLGMVPVGSFTLGFVADAIGTKRALMASATVCLLSGIAYSRVLVSKNKKEPHPRTRR
ncbi:MAG TPA: MFS transporter [Nitrospirae bacterium]|nr:enterobactin exporter EntS [bacterium BMS3Abin08]HDY72262.1 MFS transporter [Nitrospirota bacterium]